MTSRTSTINHSSTSLEGITGATTPSTFVSTGVAPSATVAALLTQSDTTVTGLQVPGTTGVLVVDGTTLTGGEDAITLDNGNFISAGFNGLEDATTTANYQAITVNGSGTASTQSGGTASGVTTSVSTTFGNVPTAGFPFDWTPDSIGALECSVMVGKVISLTAYKGTQQTPGNSSPTGGASGGSETGTAASASSSAAGPKIGAGKTMALLGALGGMLAYGL
ncbi:hypothetical protein LTR37_003615 [Vermiconidia calcicola]|uniref:Uncharacterized protein n=1 Tax=Vermiconidia calcicola TaxID=1690605 RepID=A0ACC3NPG5_9PEZI|nr:hypothetical protein LTR37_003615 [Vermiconidia calcicola]